MNEDLAIFARGSRVVARDGSLLERPLRTIRLMDHGCGSRVVARDGSLLERPLRTIRLMDHGCDMPYDVTIRAKSGPPPYASRSMMGRQ